MQTLFLLIVSSLLVLSCLASERKSKRHKREDCIATQEIFHHLKLDIHTPSIPINGGNFRVCQTDYSCCTNDTFDKLSTITENEFQERIEELSSSLRSTLHHKLGQFDGFFLKLIVNAQKKLDAMFQGTYGDLYSDNADVFEQFFRDLQDYYKGSSFGVVAIFEKFFTEVMLRVYNLLYPDYELSDDYKQCIADNMATIRPFASPTGPFTPQFRRSFIAARAFVKGLEAGKLIVKKASKFHVTPRCRDELLELGYCATCRGVRGAHPCPSLCRRAMTNCFHGYHNLSAAWQSYTGGLIQLLDRLDSPINIESILDTFDVKTSEAIMTLQDNSANIDEAVRRSCGSPPVKKHNSTLFDPGDLSASYLSSFDGEKAEPHLPRDKRSASDTGGFSGKRRRSGRRRSRKMKERLTIPDLEPFSKSSFEERRFRYRPPHNAHGQRGMGKGKKTSGVNLKTLVTKMKGVLRKFDRHWASLPSRACKLRNPSAPCWDGDKLSGSPKAPEEEARIEVDLLVGGEVHPSILIHVRKLDEVSARLKQAHRGVDSYAGTTDDEDTEPSGDGSGSDPDVRNAADEVLVKASPSPPTTTPCEGDCGDAPSFSSSLVLVCCSILITLFSTRLT